MRAPTIVKRACALLLVLGTLGLTVAGAEPAGATDRSTAFTVERGGRYIEVTTERLHELQVHATVVLQITNDGNWWLTVYANNTARTRKHVNAGATIRSPATGLVMELNAPEVKLPEGVSDVWLASGTNYDLADVWYELYRDPDLSFDLWMSASRL